MTESIDLQIEAFELTDPFYRRTNTAQVIKTNGGSQIRAEYKKVDSNIIKEKLQAKYPDALENNIDDAVTIAMKLGEIAHKYYGGPMGFENVKNYLVSEVPNLEDKLYGLAVNRISLRNIY